MIHSCREVGSGSYLLAECVRAGVRQHPSHRRLAGFVHTVHRLCTCPRPPAPCKVSVLGRNPYTVHPQLRTLQDVGGPGLMIAIQAGPHMLD